MRVIYASQKGRPLRSWGEIKIDLLVAANIQTSTLSGHFDCVRHCLAHSIGWLAGQSSERPTDVCRPARLLPLEAEVQPHEMK